MRRRRSIHRWLLVALGAVVALGVVAPVGAQEAEGSLVIRSLDGSDPTAVDAEFIWTGDRAQVPDLVVRENGEIVASTLPVRLDADREFGIVLAIDTSGSMEENNAFQQAIAAARGFIESKEPTDQLAIVGFGTSVDTFASFTADEGMLLDALDRLGVGGGTALYDAVRESVNLFEGTDLVPNIVLLTDGRDKDSSISEEAAANLLSDSNSLLYALGIDNGDLDLGPLERLTERTGGAVLSSADASALAGFYDDVQGRLRRQFRTTFASGTDVEGPAAVTFTIGATSDEASFTPGAALRSPGQIEPVVVPGNGGIDALQSDGFLWLALFLVLLGVGGTVFAVGMALIGDRRSLDRVLQPYSDGFVAPEEGEERLATSAILQRAVALTGQFAERRGVLRRVEDMLERANLPLRAAEAIFFYLVAVVLLGIVGGALAGAAAAGVIVLVIAALAPPAAVLYLAERRRGQFQEQLPDFLALIASTLRSGYSLMQGVEAAAQEVIEPTKRELQRVVTEARLGMPLDDALHNVSLRMNSRDFEWAVMAISIQREVGGNLAELLDTVADTMRERDRLRRDIKSLTAEGRISAIVLGLLPIGLGIMIYVLNPDYISSMFDRTLGLVMLGGAGFLMVLGFGWMYKIIDIEV